MSKIKINSESGSKVTVNAPGKGSSVTVNAPDPPAPSAAVSVSKQQINVTWPPHASAMTYILLRDTVEAMTNAQQVFAGNQLYFIDTGLSQNTTYYYQVKWADEESETIIDLVSATTLNAAVTYDIDAEAIIGAIQSGATLDTAQKEAIDDFINTLKTNSLWTKMKGLYVGVFASPVSNRVNWVQPDFNMVGHPELFIGAITHNAGKISFAGVPGASDLVSTRAFSTNYMVPSKLFSLNNIGFTFRITDAPIDALNTDKFAFGCTNNAPDSGIQLILFGKPQGISKNEEIRINGANVSSNIMDDHIPGDYTFQRIGSTSSDVLLRKDSVDILASLNDSTTLSPVPIGTGGHFTNLPTPNALSYLTYGRSFFAIHEALTGGELTIWETAYRNLLTAL